MSITPRRTLTLADLPANRRAYAQGEGRPVFEAFADLDAVEPLLRVVSLAGLPGAFAMIELAEARLRVVNPAAGWTDRLKMFLGFCTARAMDILGYPPRHIKRAIPHPSFSRGEVYEVPGYQPLLKAAGARTLDAAAEGEDIESRDTFAVDSEPLASA